MTEEKKVAFKAKVKRIAGSIIALTKEFPELEGVTIGADSTGYFSATGSDEKVIYNFYSIPGLAEHFCEIRKVEE